MTPSLWVRAEGVRTFLRADARALAPLAFGGASDVLGNPRHSLQITLLVMLAPMAVSGITLLRGIRHYPRDVANAAASASRVARTASRVRSAGSPVAGDAPLSLPFGQA